MNNHHDPFLKPLPAVDRRTSGAAAFPGGRLLIPVCFALVIVLFAFDFCEFRIIGEITPATVTGTADTPLSGFNLITGRTLPGHFRMEGSSMSDFPEAAGQLEAGTGKISPDIWAIGALIAAAGGVIVFLRKEKREAVYGITLAMAGFICLLILWSSVKNYETKIDTGFFTIRTEMSFHFAYWAALFAFAMAGCTSYLRSRQKEAPGSRSKTHTPIHIHIITKSS